MSLANAPWVSSTTMQGVLVAIRMSVGSSQSREVSLLSSNEVKSNKTQRNHKFLKRETVSEEAFSQSLKSA